jgi:hypothetical protein
MVDMVDDAAAADERQKAIDNWLPVTASRKAKWWYSAFHNITAMVGAGVLTLPYAMSKMGWYIFYLSIYHKKNLSPIISNGILYLRTFFNVLFSRFVQTHISLRSYL